MNALGAVCFHQPVITFSGGDGPLSNLSSDKYHHYRTTKRATLIHQRITIKTIRLHYSDARRIKGNRGLAKRSCFHLALLCQRREPVWKLVIFLQQGTLVA